MKPGDQPSDGGLSIHLDAFVDAQSFVERIGFHEQQEVVDAGC